MQKSLLFIPGPVAVSEPVLAAMAKPLINHRGPEYARLLQRNLRILNGSPTEDDLAPLRIATGSGPVLSVSFGYAF